MKFQDGAGGDSDGGDDWVLTKSGSRKQTHETQNRSEGTAHGLGLSSSEKREQHSNFNFARRCGQRETRQAQRIRHRSSGQESNLARRLSTQAYDTLGRHLVSLNLWKTNALTFCSLKTLHGKRCGEKTYCVFWKVIVLPGKVRMRGTAEWVHELRQESEAKHTRKQRRTKK